MGFFKKLFKPSSKQPVKITDDNFHEEVVNSAIPVVLDVWGTNCAPCQKLMPIMMKLAARYDEKVKVCEMLADENPKTVLRYKIKGTPTVLYFQPGGQLEERVSGFRGWMYHMEIIENDLLDDGEPPAVNTSSSEDKPAEDDVPPASERGVSQNPAPVKASRRRRRKAKSKRES